MVDLLVVIVGVEKWTDLYNEPIYNILTACGIGTIPNFEHLPQFVSVVCCEFLSVLSLGAQGCKNPFLS